MNNEAPSTSTPAFRRRLAGLAAFCIPVSAGLGYLVGGWGLMAASAGTCLLIFLALIVTSVPVPHAGHRSRRVTAIAILAFLVLGAMAVAALLVAGIRGEAAGVIVALAIVAGTGGVALLALDGRS